MFGQHGQQQHGEPAYHTPEQHLDRSLPGRHGKQSPRRTPRRMPCTRYRPWTRIPTVRTTVSSASALRGIQGLALRRWATTDTHGAIYLAANRDLRRRNHASQGQQRLCTPFDAILALGMRTKERRRLENTQPAPSCTHTTAYLATGRRQRYIATPTPTARQILETSPSSHHRH